MKSGFSTYTFHPLHKPALDKVVTEFSSTVSLIFALNMKSLKVQVVTFKVRLEKVKLLELMLFPAKIKVLLFGELMDETAWRVVREDLSVWQVERM